MDEDREMEEVEQDWEEVLTEILMRASDGEISDDDTAYVVSHLPLLGDNLQEWLQGIADKLGPENIQIILMLIMIYKMRKK